MSQTSTPPTQPRTPVAEAVKRASEKAEMYRSIADGELATAWSLRDYFGSLNTVMRLQPKVRQKVERAAKKTPGGEQMLALFDRMRIPTGWLVVGFLLAVAVLIVRPIVLDATGSGADALIQAHGVWQAGKGKYDGRTFEITSEIIAFGTGEKNAGRSTHKIEKVRARSAVDSTLFTVTYQAEGKSSEFAFWYYGGPAPVIRFKNQHDIIWRKSGAQPTAQPNR
jgi:hypothetical protein